MVLFSALTSKFNRTVAPFVLKHGLSARFVLALGKIKDNPFLDGLLMIPFSQKLLEIEVQDMALEAKQPTKVKSKLDIWTETIFDSYILPRLASTTNQQEEIEEQERERIEQQKKNDNPRLYAFETYLRPILTPNDEWADIERWRFHARFCKWLRSEYLICKYSQDIKRALSTHSKLNVTPLLQRSKFRERIRKGIVFSNHTNSRENNKDYSSQNYAPLPTMATLNNAFQMKDWAKVKDIHSDHTEMVRITHLLNGTMKDIGSNVQIPVIDPNTSVKHLEFQDILEVAGCYVAECNAFNALCEEGGIYEFWTEEYVSTLADYLLERSKVYDGETIILDIGAGDGTLVHFLDMYMSEKLSGQRKSAIQKLKTNRWNKAMKKPTVIAVDDGSWNIEPKAPVEKLDYTEALEKFKPYDSGIKKHQLILIASWMPMFVDWTQSFRDYEVDEYILIGQKDDGNCGDNWHTWGNEEYLENGIDAAVAPYKSDGYQRQDLDELSKLQFSRFDTKSSSSSATVSFRKL